MRGLTVAWLTFVGVATWRYETDPANTSALPPPSTYIGAAMAYSILGLLATAGPDAGRLAAAMGWALVVAGATTGVLIPADKTTKTTTSAAKPPAKPKAATHA